MSYENVNPDIIEALREYGNCDAPFVGHFLSAVLSNNLVEAFRRADLGNRAAMHDIVSYCYNELPSACWGSPEKVAAWLDRAQARRQARVPA